MLKEGDSSPTHYDKGELIKLPPFNEFLRKKIVESMEDIKCLTVEKGVYKGAPRLPRRKQTIEDIQAQIKSIALKKKLEIIESREVKDKKAAPPAKESKEQPKTSAADEKDEEIDEIMKANKVELVEGMKELTKEPEYYPWV